MPEKDNLFTPLVIRGVTFPNRLGVSALCTYDSDNGHLKDFHLVHYGRLAMEGYGFIVQESTAICPEGRTTPNDLIIYDESVFPELKRVIDYVHQEGSLFGIQLNHAGRKGGFTLTTNAEGDKVMSPLTTGQWPLFAPSPIPYDSFPAPIELSEIQITQIIQQFVVAAQSAVMIGYDFIEIHAGHGFLIHQFLSPLSNKRVDGYGGSFENRTRLLREICTNIRSVIPNTMPLFVRLSASDYASGGITINDAAALARDLYSNYGVDLIDVSAGGLIYEQVTPKNWDEQLRYAKTIKESGVAVAAVGGICSGKVANKLIEKGEADLVMYGKATFRNSIHPRHIAKDIGAPIPPYHKSIAWATKIPFHSKY